MANGKGGSGSGTGPTGDQLKIAQQMFAVMEQMKQSADKISRSFELQAESSAKMAENMKDMSTGDVVTQLVEVNKTLKEVAESLKNLNQSSAETFQVLSSGATTASTSVGSLAGSMEKVGTSTQKTSSSVASLTKHLKDNVKQIKGFKDLLKQVGSYLEENFPIAVGAALGALSGLTQVIKNVMAVGQGMLGIASSLISTFFEIGRAILTAPIKMFTALMETANSASGGISELAEAINNLRKEFGSLAGPTNSAIMTLSKSMGSLNIGGLSATQAFGNVADRINLLKDLFSQGGAAIRQYTGEIVKSNGAVLAYQKGLGLSNEEMGTLASYAKRDGKSITTVLNNITKQADAMGKKFGLDAKLISKGMAKASQDMAHFGHMSEKQLAVAVTYAHRLGLEIDQIAGSLDQFATFEDAAENVASLNSAFNANIDLSEVMQAQSPDQIFELIRKGLMDAGVSADKMDFRTRKLVKQLTGFSDEAINAGLSTANMSKSLKDVQKEGEKAEKKTMSQEEAMSKLADAIDRVFKSGGERPKTFWEAFVSGLEKGIFRTKEMMRLMQNIRLSTDKFTQAGIKLGEAFVRSFPGVSKILNALSDLFDPNRIGGLLDKFVARVEKFFKDMQDGDFSFSSFMDDIMQMINDFFGDSGKGISGLKEGLWEFFNTLSNLLGQGIQWVMEKLAGFINDIVDYFTNPDEYNKNKAAARQAMEAGQSLMLPIVKGFDKGMEKLGPAVNRLFELLQAKLKAAIKELTDYIWKEYQWWIMGYLFLQIGGPMMVGGLIGAVYKMFSKGFTGGVDKAIPDIQKAGGQVAKTAGDSVTNVGNEVGQKGQQATSKIQGFFNGVKNVIKGIFETISEFIKGIGEVGKTLVKTIVDLGNQIITGLKTIVTNVGSLLQEFLNVARDLLDKIIEIVNTQGQRLVSAVFNVAKQILKNLNDLVVQLKPILTNIVQTIGAALKETAKIITEVGQIIADGIVKIVNSIMKGLAEASTQLPIIARNIGSAFGSFLTGLGSGLVTFAEMMGTPVVLLGGIPVGLIVLGMVLGLALAARIGAPAFATLGTMFEGLAKLLGDGVAPALEAAASIIKAVFEGIGTVIEKIGHAIAEVISTFADSVKKLSEISAVDLLKVAGAITTIGAAMAGFGGAAGIGGLGAALGKLFDEDPVEKFNRFTKIDAERLAAVAKAIEDFGTATKNVGSIGDNLNLDKIPEAFETLATDKFPKIVDQFKKLKDDIIAVFDKSEFAQVFSDLIDALHDELERMAESGPFKIPGFAEKFFSFPGDVASTIGSKIKGLFGTGFDISGAFQQEGMKDFSSISDKVKKDMSGLAGFFEETSVSVDPIVRAQGQISSAFDQVGDIDPQKIEEKFDSVIKSLYAIVSNPTLEQIQTNLQNIHAIQDLIGAGIIPAVKAVEDMMKAAKKIEESLNMGVQINLDAKLKTFASKFGKVGAQGAYTVQARDVNIHVKFNVTMDAAPIERIMISNGTSIIKNRLNLLMEAVQDDDKAKQVRTTLNSAQAKLPSDTRFPE